MLDMGTFVSYYSANTVIKIPEHSEQPLFFLLLGSPIIEPNLFIR